MAEEKLQLSKDQTHSETTDIEEREGISEEESQENETQPISPQGSHSTAFGQSGVPVQVPKRKGGRKPIYSTSEERKQRNRQAQAAFRTRRTDYIKNLEKEIDEQKKELQMLRESHRTAKDQFVMLSYKNALLERILTEKGIDVQAELESHTTSSFYRIGSISSPRGGASAAQRQTLIRPKQSKYKPHTGSLDTTTKGSQQRRFENPQIGSALSGTTSPQYSQHQMVYFQQSPNASRHPSFGGTPVTPQHQSHTAGFPHISPQRHSESSANSQSTAFQHYELMGNEMDTQMSTSNVPILRPQQSAFQAHGMKSQYNTSDSGSNPIPNIGEDQSRPQIGAYSSVSSSEHRQSLSAHEPSSANYQPHYHHGTAAEFYDPEGHHMSPDGLVIGQDPLGLDASMQFPSNYYE